jgi:hypothetical protein
VQADSPKATCRKYSCLHFQVCIANVAVHSGLEARSRLPQLWWVLWTHVTCCGVASDFLLVGLSLCFAFVIGLQEG